MKIYQGNGVKLEMSLKRETGFGRCISALSICNVNMFRMENGKVIILNHK